MQKNSSAIFRHGDREKERQGFTRTKRNTLIKGTAFIHLLVKIQDQEAFTDAPCPANRSSTCSTLISPYNAELVTDELTEQTAHPTHKRWPASAWQKVSDLPMLMKAPHCITSSSDLFCCLPCRGAQSKDWIVMMHGRTWMTMMKDSVQKTWARGQYTPHLIHYVFKRYDSAMQQSTIKFEFIQACVSASQISFSEECWWETQPYKCFKNMTLRFSNELMNFLLIISGFAT